MSDLKTLEELAAKSHDASVAYLAVSHLLGLLTRPLLGTPAYQVVLDEERRLRQAWDAASAAQLAYFNGPPVQPAPAFDAAADEAQQRGIAHLQVA